MYWFGHSNKIKRSQIVFQEGPGIPGKCDWAIQSAHNSAAADFSPETASSHHQLNHLKKKEIESKIWGTTSSHCWLMLIKLWWMEGRLRLSNFSPLLSSSSPSASCKPGLFGFLASLWLCWSLLVSCRTVSCRVPLVGEALWWRCINLVSPFCCFLFSLHQMLSWTTKVGYRLAHWPSLPTWLFPIRELLGLFVKSRFCSNMQKTFWARKKFWSACRRGFSASGNTLVR